MARIFLAKEVQSVIAQALAKLNNASDTVAAAEGAVFNGVAAGLTPAEVNASGIEGYQAAGILLKEASDLILQLNPDPDTGIAFPKIACIGCPAEFDRFHVDVETISAADRGAISAYSKKNAAVFPDPWTELDVGQDVLFEKFNAGVTDGGSASTKINKRKLEGIVATVYSISNMDGSRHRLVFDDTFTFYEDDKEDPTTTNAGTNGNEGETLVLRQISQ